MLYFLLLSFTAAFTEDCNSKWLEFLNHNPEKYKAEDSYRQRIFCSNLEEIAHLETFESNIRYSHLVPTAAYSHDEFNSFQNSLIPLERNTTFLLRSSWTYSGKNLRDMPNDFDWAERGVVNTVKDQGICGSCWAFGIIANLETAHVVQSGGPLYSLSEQQLVTCMWYLGCGGAYPEIVLGRLVHHQTLFETEEDYPYVAKDHYTQKCLYNPSLGKFRLLGFVRLQGEQRMVIQAALLRYGVLLTAVDSSGMKYYSSGIMTDKQCPEKLPSNHAVNIVGYGIAEGVQYWNIRNSWGKNWGVNGYFKIADNVCHVNDDVMAAIVNRERCDKRCKVCTGLDWCKKCPGLFETDEPAASRCLDFCHCIDRAA